MTKADDEAAAFYEREENRRIVGLGFRRGPRRIRGGVYISPAVLEKIRPVAEAEGITVGNWIRATIDRELERSEKRHSK